MVTKPIQHDYSRQVDITIMAGLLTIAFLSLVVQSFSMRLKPLQPHFSELLQET